MLEESFKLVPRDRDKDVYVISSLILLPAEADLVPKERRKKRYPGRLRSFSGSKIVLTLLIEVVAVHVRLSVVYVRKRAFNFSRGTLETTGARAGAEAGAQTSRTALKIFCKPSSEYLGILVVMTEVLAMEGFVFEGLAGWSDNLSPDLGDGEESGRATERATKRMTEG